MGFGAKIRPDHAVLGGISSNLATAPFGSGARDLATLYTNSGGGVRWVMVDCEVSGGVASAQNIQCVIGGVLRGAQGCVRDAVVGQNLCIEFLVPIGVTYNVDFSGAGITLHRWFEADFS